MPNFPASRTVHCPSGPTHACDLHAAQITGLMRFLGAHVVHTVAPDGAQCENCKNEAGASVPNVEHDRRTAASSPGVRVDGPVEPHAKD